ncbi:cellulose binding domain-containing protein [Pseudosporangium ferrugineum]|uniref:Cellulose binding domain-containing protein n=1 Tax=Pseudosporangium ferrugineum TaxID=439699 RepID=A0A2T0S3D8_9ACTN|nr:cellulose binding domain-containing protein [Pseudosporangium ferrugineum]PRY27935.1 cellulose binding domain-containing protein [Pseudosporangium ferrugineum]
MSGKHTMGQLGLPRYSFIAAAATLLVILVAWVAVRAAGPTENQSPVLVVPPSTPVVQAGAALPSTIPIASPPASATPSPTPSRTPSARPTPSRSSAVPKKPKPKPTTKPTPSRTTPTATFSARYASGASWDQGFIGGVQVTNTGPAAGAWRVSISYSSRAGVRVTNVWNAQVSHSGNTWTFTADNLAPGAQANFGYQATKQSRGPAAPTSCTVNGTPCRTG